MQLDFFPLSEEDLLLMFYGIPYLQFTIWQKATQGRSSHKDQMGVNNFTPLTASLRYSTKKVVNREDGILNHFKVAMLMTAKVSLN